MHKLSFTSVGGSHLYWVMKSNVLPLSNEVISYEQNNMITKYKVIRVSRVIKNETGDPKESFVVEVQEIS